MTIYLGADPTIFPRLKVEIAFQTDPYATPTWTDVTAYVRGDVSVKRGRNFENGVNEAGSASLTLENTDGRFDPFNGSSPYSPYVLPFRPVQITATDSAGTVYPIFRGYIERWPQAWSGGGNYGSVSVTAVDGFKTVLGYIFGPRYSDVITGDLALNYFRLNEPSSTTCFNSGSAAGQPASAATYNGGFTLGQAGAITGSPDAAVLLNGTTGYIESGGGSYAYSLLLNNSASSCEVWAKPTAILTDSTQRGVMTDRSSIADNTLVSIQYGATAGAARWTVRVCTGGTTFATLTSTTVPTAGRYDHLVVVYDLTSSATVKLYVNGAVEASTALTGTATNPGQTYTIGRNSFSGTGYFNGTVDEFATYSYALNASQVARHYRIATSPIDYGEFAQELTGSRINHILDATAWPASLRNVEGGLSTLQATGSVDTKTALALLQEVAAAELGNVFIDAAGRFAFHSRSHRSHDATHVVFGEGGAAVTRTNLITNPSVETNTTGWLANGIPAPTLTQSAVRWKVGSKALRVTWAAGATFLPDAAWTFTTTVGQTYTVSAYVYVETGQPAVAPYIYGLVIRPFTTVYDAWTRIWVTFTATGTVATFGILPAGVPTAGQFCDVDAGLLETGSTLGTYFDGTTSGGAWTGTAHASTSTTTLDDPEIPYQENVQVDFDDTYVYNDVKITQANTSPVFFAESLDSTSITLYGPRTFPGTGDLPLVNSSDVTGMAATILARYKQPVGRLSTLSVEVKSNPTIIAATLVREIGELVTVKRRPMGAPAISLDVFIDGIQDQISATGWVRTFMLTPKLADPTY